MLIGISSYGVSMTTLEEVFLHLGRDEDNEETSIDNLSTKLVTGRAISRSLSLQSKSNSYQSLKNEDGASKCQDNKGTSAQNLVALPKRSLCSHQVKHTKHFLIPRYSVKEN